MQGVGGPFRTQAEEHTAFRDEVPTFAPLQRAICFPTESPWLWQHVAAHPPTTTQMHFFGAMPGYPRYQRHVEGGRYFVRVATGNRTQWACLRTGQRLVVCGSTGDLVGEPPVDDVRLKNYLHLNRGELLRAWGQLEAARSLIIAVPFVLQADWHEALDPWRARFAAQDLAEVS